MCLPISLLTCIVCCGAREVHRSVIVPAPTPVFHVPARGSVPFAHTVPGYRAHAGSPILDGRAQQGYPGRATYTGPVVTPMNNQQAPGLQRRVNVGAPNPVGEPPRAQVGTRR